MQLARANPISSVLVFLHLLESHPKRLSKFGLAHLSALPQNANSRTDQCIYWIAFPSTRSCGHRHPMFPYTQTRNRHRQESPAFASVADGPRGVVRGQGSGSAEHHSATSQTYLGG